MDEHKFQWGIFTDASKTEQYVVRCNDIDELVDAIALVKAAMKEQREAEHLPSLPEEPAQSVPDAEQQAPFCSQHNKQMKRRTATSGQISYDHRWQDANKKWHICDGKSVTAQKPSNSAPSS